MTRGLSSFHYQDWAVSVTLKCEPAPRCALLFNHVAKALAQATRPKHFTCNRYARTSHHRPNLLGGTHVQSPKCRRSGYKITLLSSASVMLSLITHLITRVYTGSSCLNSLWNGKILQSSDSNSRCTLPLASYIRI